MPKKKEQTADTEAKPKGTTKARAPKRAVATPENSESAPPPSMELLAEETLIQFEFSPDAIALRAYFLAEERRHQGLHPDPVADWLEAERQILAELSTPAAPAKKARARKKSD